LLKAALLSSEHSLNVTDFTLDLSASLFGGPTIAQVSISADLARLFFHFPFRFIDSASDFIFRARFHERESLFMKATDLDFEPASARAIATGSEHEETAPGGYRSGNFCGSRSHRRELSPTTRHQHHLAQRSHGEPSGQTCLAR
jgi:hypothetical protein